MNPEEIKARLTAFRDKLPSSTMPFIVSETQVRAQETKDVLALLSQNNSVLLVGLQRTGKTSVLRAVHDALPGSLMAFITTKTEDEGQLTNEIEKLLDKEFESLDAALVEWRNKFPEAAIIMDEIGNYEKADLEWLNNLAKKYHKVVVGLAVVGKKHFEIHAILTEFHDVEPIIVKPFTNAEVRGMIAKISKGTGVKVDSDYLYFATNGVPYLVLTLLYNISAYLINNPQEATVEGDTVCILGEDFEKLKKSTLWVIEGWSNIFQSFAGMLKAQLPFIKKEDFDIPDSSMAKFLVKSGIIEKTSKGKYRIKGSYIREFL